MSRLLTLLITLCASAALAQAPDTRSALDKAYEDTRAAEIVLRAAEAKRDQGAEPEPGERTGTVGGSSRLNEAYFARQNALDQEVAEARKRYDEAMKRWNDLK